MLHVPWRLHFVHRVWFGLKHCTVLASTAFSQKGCSPISSYPFAQSRLQVFPVCSFPSLAHVPQPPLMGATTPLHVGSAPKEVSVHGSCCIKACSHTNACKALSEDSGLARRLFPQTNIAIFTIQDAPTSMGQKLCTAGAYSRVSRHNNRCVAV